MSAGDTMAPGEPAAATTELSEPAAAALPASVTAALPEPAAASLPERVATELPPAIGWVIAVIRTARPRQWPKNLLVFAAPLAAGSMGRPDGFGYAVVAAVAFGCASAAVYFVNDVADAERDRRHPVKRNRPVASGDLPARHALVLAAVAAACSIAAGAAIGTPLLAVACVGYLASSFLYSAWAKHIPYLEMVLVASGFVLRVLAGAAATRVPPSVPFLFVCSLGALGVAVAKRYTELTSLGAEAVRHRPVMRWYRPVALRTAQYLLAVGMVATYLMWAAGEREPARYWHIASAAPLAMALARFAVLTGRRTTSPVEDMITRDVAMVACELTWLGLFGAALPFGAALS